MASRIETKTKRKRKQRSKTANAETPMSRNGKWQAARISDQWQDWSDHLSNRAKLSSLHEVLKSDKQPVMLWGFSTCQLQAATQQLATDCDRIARGKSPASQSALEQNLDQLVDNFGFKQPTLDLAVQALSICYAFPALVGIIPNSLSQCLFGQLSEFAACASKIDLEQAPLVGQLIGGELPIALARTFPEIDAFQVLAQESIHAVRYGVSELLDVNGIISAKHLADLQPLAACWIRTKTICRDVGYKLFDDKGKSTFQELMLQLLRLIRKNGAPVFSDKETANYCPALFAAALDISDDKVIRHAGNLVLPGKKVKSQSKRRGSLPEPTDYSEWAEVAILQADWSPDSPKLAVDFSNGQTRIELNCGPTLLSGHWDLTLSADGAELKPESEWSVVCWHTDDDADYIELEMSYEQGYKVQRQMLLLREDHVLCLADAVIGKTPAILHYWSALPISKSKEWHDADDTTEGFIVGKRRLASVLPLALPEWRTAFSPGKLQMAGDKLELRHEVRGSGYFPLFIDLKPSRLRKPLTWRRLTVAENLRIVNANEAAGFRVHIDNSQWLIYRSLTEPRNRTLLGQNLAHEFFLADFDADGEATELISVE